MAQQKTISQRGAVRKGYAKSLLVCGLGGFVLLLAALTMLFMHNYQQLQDSLSLERTIYISELSKQLADKVSNTQEMYYRESRFYAELLEDGQPETFADAAALLSMGREDSQGRLFLVDAVGNVYTPEGEPYPMEASEFLVKLLYDREEAASFERNDREEESWAFGCPVEPLVIDGLEIRALLNIYGADAFKSSFALALFDQQGYSFIVNKQGAIIIGAQGTQNYGYNLFASFVEIGMDKTVCHDLETHIREGESGQTYAYFDGATWLLQYDLLQNGEQYVFVLVPVSVTAAMPFHYMNQTLVIGLLAISTVSLLLFLVLFFVNKFNRRREEAVYQAELLAKSAQAKSDFMSRMSHDIRTPLNAIIGMNYIAREHLDDRALVQDSLKKMDFSANYLLELVNDMLDMQKIESGKMVLNLAPFSPRELLESLESVLRPNMEKKGLRFEIEGMTALNWQYIGDRLRVSQILMNLLSNAAKFTPANGQVLLRAEVTPLTEGVDQVTFTVADTGIGMSQAYMEKLFRPFEQENGGIASQFGGSGLGLSIVYNLVKLMGGEIQVESQQGVGSRFRITLPLRQDGPDVGTVSAKASIGKVSLEGRRVLLAEDNALNREIAQTVLEMRGLLVETEEDGQKALKRFEMSAPGYFDGIITDIQMPVMDGHQLARAIRAGSHPDGETIPILAMSANAFDVDVRAALEAGMNAHLSKPIVMEELEAALQKYLGKRGGLEPS